jgi:hypothetical protein
VGGDISAYDNVYWNTNNQWTDIFKFNNNLYGIYSSSLVKFDATAQEFVTVGDPQTDLGQPLGGVNYAGTINNTAYFMGMIGSNQTIFTWNDNNWDTLDLNNYPMRAIFSVEVMNNELFIAGAFQHTSGAVSGMLKWNGTSLTEALAYGPGMPMITMLYVTNGHLYAKYTTDVAHLGLWNGSGFSNITAELTANVNAMAEANVQSLRIFRQ